MSQTRHLEKGRHRNFCALVVLVAVFSLTVNVATRYSSPCNDSSRLVKTFQTQTSTDAKRQRLAKNAANWMPSVVCFDVLRAPAFYPRIAPQSPPVSSLLFEPSLYNRPPPSSKFLA
jgi:hypothetical protein